VGRCIPLLGVNDDQREVVLPVLLLCFPGTFLYVSASLLQASYSAVKGVGPPRTRKTWGALWISGICVPRYEHWSATGTPV